MKNKLKSLLCIILLSIPTHSSPTIGQRSGTQQKRTEARGSAFSISEAAPFLYVAAGVIFGGFMVWKMSSLEKRSNRRYKSVKKQLKTIKAEQGEIKKGQNMLAEQFKKDIATLHADITCDIKTLNDDIIKINSDLVQQQENNNAVKKLTLNVAKQLSSYREEVDERIGNNFWFKAETKSEISKIKVRLSALESESSRKSSLSSHTASTSSSGSSSPIL